eukprot:TRINITY_DN15490_c0_g3_i1.p1 TRINITY_DN15490_c0_g3~~TRINITY_DN15490_c0_g3_i1.p1  ORF type:complete len:392 (+),score=26.07 TRINITY_DN15490_c0_g3_i1:123-1298(+)
MADKTVAVILVGGPTTGTRFRPLTLNVPKPLFPLAGKPMVHHPIHACQQIPNLSTVFVIGFFEEKEFAPFISSYSAELRVPIRYLREDKSHGSAGGLFHFRNIILQDEPTNIFVINCDVCSNFPLAPMLDAHKKHGGMGTLLAKKVQPDVASEFGELVADPETKEILHYAEKPETFVSDRINCGVYVFTPAIMDYIKAAIAERGDGENYVRLDQHVFAKHTGKKLLFAYETDDFWEQIKTPGLALRCSQLYLTSYRQTAPQLLAASAAGGPTIVGDVYLHPSAKVHASAKLGPNVSVAANVRIGAGVRLRDCIVLDEVEVKENAIVMNAVVGWKSVVGPWGRVQGSGDMKARLGITILGEDVSVGKEAVVVNCIVLPHKSLNTSVQEEIIL